ncbi:hypothetical protein HYW83_06410 [Candidatus Peregrinibacteria bacterium]|nr:hypothetical protein [Candidatus Peregrinibacteria bacterium]
MDAPQSPDHDLAPHERGQAVLARIRELAQHEETQTGGTVELEATAVNREVAAVIDGETDSEKKFAVAMLAYERELHAKNFPAAIVLLEWAHKMKYTPQLSIEQGKLYFLIGNTMKAYETFRTLAENDSRLTPEQTHEVLWFLFKTLRVREITQATQDLFQDNVRLLLDIQQRLGISYDDILRITELALAFRRGYNAVGDNEGSALSGYDETIQLGEALPEFEKPRVEADHRRLIGASYLKKAEERRDFFVKAKPYCDEGGIMRLRKEQLNLLETAEAHTRRAMALLEKTSGLETEGGELLRTAYNLAKILCLKAAAVPGNSRMFSDASQAIGHMQILSEQAKNPLMRGMVDILYGELLRFGWHDPAGEDELKMALASNQKALEAGSGNIELLLSVLINSGGILLALAGPEQAKPYIEQATELFFERADLRVVRWAEESLRNLAKQVGIIVKRPKATLFASA